MSLRLTIHNSVLLVFLLISVFLLALIMFTWQAFDKVNAEQEALINTQIPQMRALGVAIDEGMVLLGFASLLSHDINIDQYNQVSDQAAEVIDAMNVKLRYFDNHNQDFNGLKLLLKDTQLLTKEMGLLLALSQKKMANKAAFTSLQSKLELQMDKAIAQAERSSATVSDQARLNDTAKGVIASVKRFKDIIRFLVLIDNPELLDQEKQQHRLLVARVKNTLQVASLGQAKPPAQTLAPLQNILSDYDRLLALVEQSLALDAAMGARKEAIAQLSIRLNEDYRSTAVEANLAVESSALGLLQTISSSKKRLLIFLVIFLLSLAALFYYFFKPQIIVRLQKLNQSTRAIANGNFKSAIPLGGNDEIADMAQSLTYFREELKQKQVDQETLSVNEKTLSTIIESVSEGLFTVDVSGNIQSFNPACELIFNVDAKTVLGSSIYQFFPEQKILFTEHLRGWIENAEKGYVLCERLKVIANNYSGVSFTGSLSVTLVHLRDELIYTCFIRDITAEEFSKIQLDSLVQELSASNVDLERFAYSCSHDLQEPLRMMASFSDLLKSHLAEKGEMDETTERYLSFISEGSKNAKRLVFDILEYSRLSQGPSKKTEFVVNDIFEQIESMLHNFLEENNGQFRIENGDVKILAVPAQFKQLLMNLMINGMKYNESEQPVVTVSIIDEEQNWLISVADNGMGIDPQYQDKIFGLFTRLVSRRDYSGSGIGLSLCKKIVDKHKGTIAVTSAAGEGARFDVRLPKFSELELSAQ